MKDEDGLKKSASGGFLYCLSEQFIQNGAIVYGVSYSADFQYAEYMRCTNREDIGKTRSSKYIQARKGDTFLQVKRDLLEGKMVLFVGLPCEVNALKLFLRNEQPNLYTCALICHGPTSEKVHQEYCSDIINKARSQLRHFTVRDKKEGWKPYYIRADFENGQQHLEAFSQSTYGKAFLYMKRPSCNVCQIKRGKISADIVAGDFHYGYGTKEEPYHPYGVSNMLVYTQKGMDMLRMLQNFVLKEIPLEHVLHNASYLRATPVKNNRKAFGNAFASGGLQQHVTCIAVE